MTDEQLIDLSEITPEQFVQLVRAAEDDQLVDAVRQVGTEPVLDRVFEGMAERFRPDRAEGVNADVQFVVEDDGEQHPYLVRVAEGSCSIERGRGDDPRVTLTTDLLNFLKLTSGEAAGPSLFMSGRLKISGELMFAAQVTRFFEIPDA
jgi:putative sterol carrier protein